MKDICLVTLIQEYEKGKLIVPFGLLSLATVLKSNNVSVSLLDLSKKALEDNTKINDDFFFDAAKQIHAKKTRFIGISSMSDSLPASLLVAECCKKIDPSITIILGGPYPSSVDIEIIEKYKQIDIIVRNEGEKTIVELIECLKNNLPLNNVKGITFRTDNGEIIKTNQRDLIKDIDCLPLPNFELLGNMTYYEAFIEAGRGCPFNCSFCSTNNMWGRKFRMHSLKRIIQDMDDLVKFTGSNDFSLMHDLFTLNKKFVMNFCNEIIKRKKEYSWACGSRIDTIDTERLRVMFQAGCTKIAYGVETGSKEMMEIIGKGINVDEVLPTMKKTINEDIEPAASFVVGFYEETEENLNATMELTFKCKNLGMTDVRIFKLIVFPKTREWHKHSDKLKFHPYCKELNNRQITSLEEDLIKSDHKLFSCFYSLTPKYNDIEMIYSIEHFFSHLVHWHNISYYYAMIKMNETALSLFKKICLLCKEKVYEIKDIEELDSIYIASLQKLMKEDFNIVRKVLCYEKDKRIVSRIFKQNKEIEQNDITHLFINKNSIIKNSKNTNKEDHFLLFNEDEGIIYNLPEYIVKILKYCQAGISFQDLLEKLIKDYEFDINIKEELKNDIKTTTLNTIKTLIKLGDVILIK
jgi:radical SAM superfamily enzyme YgiQ (UPF0313 family)